MIAQLALSRLDIPFKTVFKHASARRIRTESLWVEARSIGGSVGFGEACPRSYVTGESIGSARRFFFAVQPSLMESITSIDDLLRWADGHRGWIDDNPAAWCAVELALLDLLARERGETVESALCLRPAQGRFSYSAVLGDDDDKNFAMLLEQYRAAGFRDFKIKLCGQFDRDKAKVERIGRHGPEPIRLRVDANNLWRDPIEAVRYLRALDAPLFAIEEPLWAGRFAELAEMAQALDTRIVLDESLTRLQQLRCLDGDPSRWIVNLRVSKLGGYLRSMELTNAVRDRGLGLIIGAQVGETSLLTRAALGVAANARDILIAQEGAFGLLLLESDICSAPLQFGPGGVLDLAPSTEPGLQIDCIVPPDCSVKLEPRNPIHHPGTGWKIHSGAPEKQPGLVIG